MANSQIKYEKIGLIGGGNMASAIVSGILKAKLFSPSSVYVSHPSAFTATGSSCFNNQIKLTDNNIDVVQACDLLVICVKPQVLQSVCDELKDFIDPARHLIVSICAGVTLSKLKTLVDTTGRLKLIRCSLNTASVVGESCSVFCCTPNLDKIAYESINGVLSSIGLCLGEVKESEIDTVMSISASGIAYMYLMCDAIADGGVKMGLNKQLALKMAVQTMYGASKLMLHESNKHPQQLKDEVCSPGGMTICGVLELEKHGFKYSLMSAVEAAVKRAKELNS
jgi:pyrroline-5-carboxylate reductase